MTSSYTRARRTLVVALMVVVGLAGGIGWTSSSAQSATSATFNPNYLMSDAVFDNTGTMTTAQIQTFLNQYPNSCLRSYTDRLPLDYSNYGSNVSAATIISTAASMYDINPQVLLVTLEKEQSLVTGGAGCPTWRYWSAMGYACPDGGARYNYPSLGITGTCVSAERHAGFSAQVNHGAWQLQFNRQRAIGNLNWRDNQNVTNYGFYTKGTYRDSASAPLVYHDGKGTLLGGDVVTMTNGVTATLYTYTPHLSANQAFVTLFTNWFGSTTGSSSSSSTSSPSSTTSTTIAPDPLLEPEAVAAYVNSSYRVFLNRPANTDEQAWWLNYLVSGNSRTTFATTVTKANEYRRYLVSIDYVTVLHRAPDPDGLTAWANYLGNVQRNDRVLASLAGSNEYYRNRGANDPATFVTNLYLDFLGRNVDAGGLQLWTDKLANGAMTRTQVASTILGSSEFASRLVNQNYLLTLGRAADAAGLNYWTSTYLRNRSVSQIRVALAASAEGAQYLSSLQ